ncbi:MAG: hypothetical protein GY851_19405 [bacterium]|nr:hypothetical protein [bacterium]
MSGLIVAWSRFPETTFGILGPQTRTTGDSGPSSGLPPDVPVALDSGIAGEYVRAVCDGRTDRVIELTQWMRERIEHVRMADGTSETLSEARDELAHRLTVRKVECNQLRQEGIEDQYVLAPGTEIVPIAVDEGRKDLAKPTAQRVWFRVSYPRPDRALRDVEGRPVRSVVVGVNVSEDGLVLKAGVAGNLDVNLASVTRF